MKSGKLIDWTPYQSERLEECLDKLENWKNLFPEEDVETARILIFEVCKNSVAQSQPRDKLVAVCIYLAHRINLDGCYEQDYSVTGFAKNVGVSKRSFCIGKNRVLRGLDKEGVLEAEEIAQESWEGGMVR